MYHHQPRHLQINQHHHSNKDQQKDSKYYIHIDDQHTQSQIDLDLTISVHPHHPTFPSSNHQRPQYYPKTYNNASFKQKPFITTEAKRYENPQINDSKETNKKFNKYEGHPDPVMEYTENERDYSYQPILTEKYFKKSESNKKKKNVSIKMERVKTQEEQLFEFYKKRCTEKLKSRSKRKSLNKTFKTNRSLSPQCERITQKLYHQHINNQPCTKLIHHHATNKRKKMALALENYTFLKRYLTQNQIQSYLEQFESEDIPQYKWPMHIVQIVNEKLNHMHRH